MSHTLFMCKVEHPLQMHIYIFVLQGSQQMRLQVSGGAMKLAAPSTSEVDCLFMQVTCSHVYTLRLIDQYPLYLCLFTYMIIDNLLSSS